MAQGRSFIYLFLLSIALGFAGWYYVHKQRQWYMMQPPIHGRDYYAKGIDYKQYDQTGRVSRRYQSSELIHYPEHNKTLFSDPIVEVYQANMPPWKITAKRGKALQGNDVITLWNNVRIHQNGSKQHAATTILTEKIDFFPSKHLASTDQLITYQQPGSTIKANGMRANLATQHIELISKARGHYVKTPHA